MIPFLAITEDDLGDPLSDSVICPANCGKIHRVRTYGPLQTIRCGDTSYLVGMNGREIKK